MDDSGPEPIPGWRFDGGGGSPRRTYRRGRLCAEPSCETQLSVYNSGRYCAQHETGNPPRVRGRRAS